MKKSACLLVLLLAATTLGGCIDLGGTGATAWAYDAVQLDEMADQGRTGAGVRIAVLDTGIDVDHPSLDHLVDGDDGNGEMKAFRDFIQGSRGIGNAYDDDGHGSHVAGIISARGGGGGFLGGGIDLQGGAPDAWLYVARVCGGEQCSSAGVRNAVDWARSHNVDIITLSLGGPQAEITLNPGSISQAQQQQQLEDAIDRAVDKGITVVASAGNDGPDNDDVTSPSDVAAVIAVGAVGEDLRVADFSSRGSGETCQQNPILGQSGRCHPNKKPDLVAPGVAIVSAWTDGAFVEATGTSQAAPFVAAVVATVLQENVRPTDRAGVMDLKQALVDSAKKVSGQTTPHDTAAGYGLVQASAALDQY